VPIAVTSPGRIDLMPQVPALGEHPALKGYDLVAWYALMAPRGLHPATISRLQRALQETLQDTDARQKLERAGVVIGRGDEDLAQRISADAVKFKHLVEFAGMRQ
jgi:tripartite-type tricarboxylate transporter receptor subunit TctC